MDRLHVWIISVILLGQKVSPSSVPLQCPESQGWSLTYGRCVAPVPTVRSWSSALRYCQRYGAKLAEPRGRQLFDQYTSIAERGGLQRAWLGLNRRNYIGTRKSNAYWSDGRETNIGVGVWGDFQPDWGKGDCVYAESQSNQWKWFSGSCDLMMPSMCEYTPCVQGTFRCATTGRCVGQVNVCDGEDDCGDNSDERNCGSYCAYHQYDESGEIKSPGYDGISPYSPRTSCVWTIEGPIGSVIQLKLLDFSTERDLDMVEFWEGSPVVSESKCVRKLSGMPLNDVHTILSSNNFLIVRFTSDGTSQNKGFWFQWKAKYQCQIIQMNNLKFTGSTGSRLTNVESSRCEQECSNNVTCTGFTYNKVDQSCTLTTEVRKPMEDTCCDVYAKTCPYRESYPILNEMPNLGGTVEVQSSMRQIYSPLYPTGYPGDTEAVWVIRTSYMNVITVMVIDVHLCGSDSVVIKDGDSPLSVTLMTLTSDSSSDVYVMSTGSVMYIHMFLMSHMQCRGVLLETNAGCNRNINAKNGVVFSPGYGVKNYPGGLSCKSVIETPSSGPMLLTFTDFNLENGKDFLKVYRGSDNTGTAVHTGSGYTGSTTPPAIAVPSGSLCLEFTTSAVGGSTGYKAVFTAGCQNISSTSLTVTPQLTQIFPGASLSVTCATGYFFQEPYSGLSSVNLECQTGGSYSAVIPVCAQAFCGVYPIVANGYIVLTSGFDGGDDVTYACEDGYTPGGSLTITCGSNGVWGSPPTCTASSCSPLPVAVANGQRTILTKDGLQHGSVLNYSCDTYFNLIGFPVIECVNGAWSHSPPICQRISCPDQYIANGTVDRTGPGLYINDQLTVMCKTGFELQGSAKYSCGVDTQPTCVNIDECQRGTATCNQLCEDTIGGYICSCRSGYQPTSWNVNICENINECLDNNGLCDAGCVDTEGSYYCTCPTGQELYMTNGQNGMSLPSSESGLEPQHRFHINHTCIDTLCPRVNLFIGNGRALTRQTTFFYGAEVTYLCYVGYYINGTQTASKTITCLPSGAWSAPEPQCVVASCSLDIPASSAVTPQTSISYGQSYNLQCVQPNGAVISRRRYCSYNTTTREYNTTGDREQSGLYCPVLDCAVPAPVKGANAYSYTCTQYLCTFEFTCRSVYTRAGKSSLQNSTVQCGADGRWDFGDLRCIDALCDDPGYPPGSRQVATSYEEGSLVTFTCLRNGYTTKDPYPIICQQVGDRLVWNSSDVSVSHECIDVAPPFFNDCPQTNYSVQRFSAPNHVVPTAYDNSGMASVTVLPTNHQPDQIIAATTAVTYTATDLRGNTGKCLFYITIKDNVPPVLTCLSSRDFVISQEDSVVTVDSMNYVSVESGAQVVSNVGVVQLSKLDIGKALQVVFTATDSSGNTASCRTQMTASAPKCQPWTLTIENGEKICSSLSSNSGYSCVFTCHTDFVMFEDINLNSVTITCTTGNDWSREVPKCRRRTSSVYGLSFRLQYETGPISDSSCTGIYDIQLNAGWNTNLQADLQTLCRSGSAYDVEVTTPTDTTKPLFTTTYDSGTTSNFVYVTINMDIAPSGFPDVAYEDCAGKIINAFQSRDSSVSSVQTLSQSGTCPQSTAMTYIQTLSNRAVCTGYEGAQKNISDGKTYCVNCPLGYFTRDKRECVACPTGTYLDIPSFDVCLSCPDKTNSKQTGLSNRYDCYWSCPLGMVSTTGEAPCNECAYNKYSNDGRTCTDCPQNTETLSRGSSNITDCLAYCQPGYYSYNGLQPCTACPKNYYQPYTKQTTCYPCTSSQITTDTASDSQADCVDGRSTWCSPNPCQNSGYCFVANHEFYCQCATGYSGRTCDTRINPCQSSPCYNGGSCLFNATTGGYTCQCSGRYNGTRCQHDLNDCPPNQCKNGGVCQDLDASFDCLCPSYSGYTGSSCETPVDPCSSADCKNNATCVAGGNIHHKCVCQPGYTGASCDTNIDECLSNPCINGGTCVDGITGYSCGCPTGYSGQFCQTRGYEATCHSGNCGSDACIDIYVLDSAMCVCLNGYIRKNGECKIRNYCDDITCQNGACLSLSGGAVCQCESGYAGPSCQNNVNDCASNPCQNGGACSDRVNGYRCTCNRNGTGGNDCVDNVNECSSNPCDASRTETCYNLVNDFYCHCKEGYRGKTCSEGDVDCDSYPCLHGGTCSPSGTSYTCSCASGWTGTNCEQLLDACDSDPCHTGSTCVNKIDGATCVCQEGYRGTTCSTSYNLCNIANPCVGQNSTCSVENGQPKCECSSGYTGSSCNLPLVSCESSTCQNGGTCYVSGGQVRCTCVPGYTGLQCQTDIDECAASPCPSDAVCLDGINSYTCQCIDGKIGESCQKSFTYDFDFVVESYMERCYWDRDVSQMTTFSLGATKLSIAFWLRYTDKSRTGPILTLYGLSSPTSVPQIIFQLSGTGGTATIGSATSSLSYDNTNIMDGYWHHMTLTWSALSGQNQIGVVSLYVDSISTDLRENIGTGIMLPALGWITVGGVYDTNRQQMNWDNGFVGRISRLYYTTTELATVDVLRLHADLGYMPADILHTPITNIVQDKYIHIDHNSQLTAAVCRTAANCKEPFDAINYPSVVDCPGDQMAVTSRVASPSWPSLSFRRANNTIFNYKPGESPMPWNVHGIYSAGYDTDGNAAVCTFLLFNHRVGCNDVDVLSPAGGGMSCEPIADGQSCTAICTDQQLSQAKPKYFTCSMYDQYDTYDRLAPFRFPACADAVYRKLDLTLRVNYEFSGSCEQLKSALISQLLVSTLVSLNNQWNAGICGTQDCTATNIDVACSSVAPGEGTAQISLENVQDPLTNTQDSSVTTSAADLMLEQVIDSRAMDYSGMTAQASTLDIGSTPSCDKNSADQLIDNYCVQCGYGTYYDTTSQTCLLCPVASYQDQTGQSSCKSCPQSTTTYQTGTQVLSDCKASCLEGQYYSSDIFRCRPCDRGFYQSATGSFYCNPCPINKTTTYREATSVTDCIDFSAATTTPKGVPVRTAESMVEEEGASAAVIIAIIIGVIIFIIAILALLFFLCRDRIQCLAKKEVLPEGDTPWKYVNRYGETNLKFVNYKLRDIREKRRVKHGDHHPFVMNKTEKYYDPNESQSIQSEEVITNNNNMFVYETLDGGRGRHKENDTLVIFDRPSERAPRSHVIEEEVEYEKPRKRGRRGKKKRKRASPEREPKSLPAVRDQGFKSRAPPSESGSHVRRRNAEDSHHDDKRRARSASPKRSMRVDSDEDY